MPSEQQHAGNCESSRNCNRRASLSSLGKTWIRQSFSSSTNASFHRFKLLAMVLVPSPPEIGLALRPSRPVRLPQMPIRLLEKQQPLGMTSEAEMEPVFFKPDDSSDDGLSDFSKKHQPNADISSTSVPRWPRFDLYTFGEPGSFGPNVTSGKRRIKGARVVLEGDPIPNLIGDTIGFYHADLVPLMRLEPPQKSQGTLKEDDDRYHDAKSSTASPSRFFPWKKHSPKQDQSEAATNERDTVTVLQRKNRQRKMKGKGSSRNQKQQESDARNENGNRASWANAAKSLFPVPVRSYVSKKKANWTYKISKAYISSSKKLRLLSKELLPEDMKLKLLFKNLLPKSPRFNLTAARQIPDSDWGRHELDVYTSWLKESLIDLFGKPGRRIRFGLRRKIAAHWQAYRMAMLAKMMSYAEPRNVGAALALINKTKDPLRKERPLFRGGLIQVRSFSFKTRATVLSRIMNPIGKPISFTRNHGLDKGYIVHNVHLLRDENNNGYLTFQGTANIATYLDINFDFGKYQAEKQGKPFAPAIDDKRWELIEPEYLSNCHRGYVDVMKAFFGSEGFSRLAEEIAGMKRVSVVGHSAGGSFASIFAKTVHAVKEVKQPTKRNIFRRRRRTVVAAVAVGAGLLLL